MTRDGLSLRWWGGSGGSLPRRGTADQSLFLESPTPALHLDAKLRVRDGNHAVAGLLGLPVGLLVGHDVSIVVGDAERTAIAELLRQGLGASLDAVAEVQGRGRTHRCRIAAVVTSHAKTPVVVHLVDLGEEAGTQTGPQERHEELRHFSYRVAHDLVGPLAALRGLAQLLAMGDVPEDRRREFATRLASSADAASGMVLDLLARADRVGGETPVRVPVEEVHDWVARMVSTTLADVGGRLVLDTDLEEIVAARGTLRTVVLNLVSNAIKYRRAGVPPEITIRVRHDDGLLRIDVVDNGRGVAPDQLATMFARGERLGRPGEGHGSGLAECERLLATMGGRIWAEQGTSEGLVVSFTLPLLEAASAVRTGR